MKQLDLFEDLTLEERQTAAEDADCFVVKLDSYKTPLRQLPRRGRESTDEGFPIKANLQLRYVLSTNCNPLYTRELYVAPDVVEAHEDLLQQLGDVGVYANTYIDESTDFVVISDASLERLKQGELDDVLRYVEQNVVSRTSGFRCIMLCESELLTWLYEFSR